MDWREYLDRATQGITDPQLATQVRDELLSHLTLLFNDLKHEGWQDEAAYGEAVKRMGNVNHVRRRLASVHYDSAKVRLVIQPYERARDACQSLLPLRSLFKIEWNRSWRNWQTWSAFALILVICVISLVPLLTFRGLSLASAAKDFETFFAHRALYHPSSMFLGIFSQGFLVFALPWCVPWVMATSLAWDRRTGLVDRILEFTNLRVYIAAKIWSASLLGFLMVLSAEFIALATSFLFYSTGPNHLELGFHPQLLATLYHADSALYAVLVAIVTALAATSVGIVGVFLATLTPRNYVAATATWLLFILGSLGMQTYSSVAYSPIALLGEYPFVTPGHGLGVGYPAAIAIIWASVWLVGSALTLKTFHHRISRQRPASPLGRI